MSIREIEYTYMDGFTIKEIEGLLWINGTCCINCWIWFYVSPEAMNRWLPPEVITAVKRVDRDRCITAGHMLAVYWPVNRQRLKEPGKSGSRRGGHPLFCLFPGFHSAHLLRAFFQY